jgi:hypothetical protein
LFVNTNVAVDAPVPVPDWEYPFHFVELSASRHVADLRFDTRALLVIVIGPAIDKAVPPPEFIAMIPGDPEYPELPCNPAEDPDIACPTTPIPPDPAVPTTP